MRLARALAVMVLVGAAALAAERCRVVEDFEGRPLGSPPAGWRAKGKHPERVYAVQQEGKNRYLHAEARGSSVTLGKRWEFDPREFPVLRWRWRVWRLPQGADERHKSTGDSAAGVYVIFSKSRFGLPPKAIKYVWSTSLPPGSVTPSPFSGRTKVVVLESGPERLGQWVTEEVNVCADYRRLFGKEPKRAYGVALLTDADNTRSVAIADYDDLVLCPPKASSAGF